MKYIGLVIVFFLVGMILVYGLTPQKKINITQTPSPSPPFYSVVNPPSESLKGSVSEKSGTIFWESRIATEPAELIGNQEVQQGERLVTKDKSNAVVNFSTVGLLKLEENTDISFNQTLPVNFVVTQTSGAVTYELNGTVPLAVRVRSALISKTTGIVKITETAGDSIILVSTIKGTAQIGYNDLEYNSQVFTLNEGQIYEYNSDDHTTINSKNK